MNIIVFKRDGTWCHRPDSTLNHKYLDYYRPDYVASMDVVPVVYTRLVKAGKCIAPRFAQRYFNESAFGCLINDTTGVSEAMASSMDFSSVMGMDFAPFGALAESPLSLEIDGKACFKATGAVTAEDFCHAISAISNRSTIRLGDIVAIEVGAGAELNPGNTLSLICGAVRHDIKIF